MSFRAEFTAPLVLSPAWEDFPGDNTSGGSPREGEGVEAAEGWRMPRATRRQSGQATTAVCGTDRSRADARHATHDGGGNPGSAPNAGPLDFWPLLEAQAAEPLTEGERHRGTGTGGCLLGPATGASRSPSVSGPSSSRTPLPGRAAHNPGDAS